MVLKEKSIGMIEKCLLLVFKANPFFMAKNKSII